MVTCDYLIIGSGFAGIGLKYKLLGKTILIDKNPFGYKIGESHIPSLVNKDPGLLSLIPKIMKMKSYNTKRGTVFCDSYHGKYATNFTTSLGSDFGWHCEREEIEKLLVKELSIEIRNESIVDIDLSKNVVTTDKNTYRFKKYLLDCSGPAMIIANKLKLVSPVGQFQGMKAQWSYWTIDHLNKEVDSWADWTVINKIGADSWMWQIPIYNTSILSMGLLHRGEPLAKEDFIDYVEKRSAACYQLTSIARNPDRAVKPYMKEVYARLHYSRRSQKCAGKNWILVGDAYCFADPVYSVGSGVAMLEAVTIADILNKNEGRFDYEWYEKNCNSLLKTVIEGIGTWYSGTAFDKKVNKRINDTILRGGFSRHFQPSQFTENVKLLQDRTAEESFTPYIGPSTRAFFKDGVKIYYFDKVSFIKIKSAVSIRNEGQSIRITNKAVQKIFEQHIIGKKISILDLYLTVELNLKTLKDKDYFWKLIRFIECIGSKDSLADRLYYFHLDKYETVEGQLKLGDAKHRLVLKDPASIEFFEKLEGKIVSSKELVKLADKNSPRMQQDLKDFFKTFYLQTTFGRSICLAGK